jgi:hypothetical protein
MEVKCYDPFYYYNVTPYYGYIKLGSLLIDFFFIHYITFCWNYINKIDKAFGQILQILCIINVHYFSQIFSGNTFDQSVNIFSFIFSLPGKLDLLLPPCSLSCSTLLEFLCLWFVLVTFNRLLSGKKCLQSCKIEWFMRY